MLGASKAEKFTLSTIKTQKQKQKPRTFLMPVYGMNTTDTKRLSWVSSLTISMQELAILNVKTQYLSASVYDATVKQNQCTAQPLVLN